MGKPNVNINVGGPDNNHPQTYKTVVLKPNIPFAQQLGSEDTIYVIKWDYDLGGEEVTVPANCVLKFEGGSLSNGALSGETIVENAPKSLLNDIDYINLHISNFTHLNVVDTTNNFDDYIEGSDIRRRTIYYIVGSRYFYSIDNLEKIIYHNNLDTTNRRPNVRILFYDRDYKFVSATDWNRDKKQEYATPSNAAFVSFTASWGGVTEYISIVENIKYVYFNFLDNTKVTIGTTDVADYTTNENVLDYNIINSDLSNFCVTGKNLILLSSNYKSYCIDYNTFKGYDFIEVEANGTTGTWVSFLTKQPETNHEEASHCPDYGDDVKISTYQHYIIPIPKDCKYIAVLAMYQGTDRRPTICRLKTKHTIFKNNALSYREYSNADMNLCQFKFVHWNIGKFSNGAHGYTDIRDEETYNAKRESFRKFFSNYSDYNFLFNEYHPIFADFNGEQKKFTDLFLGFRRGYLTFYGGANLINAAFYKEGLMGVERGTFNSLKGILNTGGFAQYGLIYTVHRYFMYNTSLYIFHTHLSINIPDDVHEALFREIVSLTSGYGNCVLCGDFNVPAEVDDPYISILTDAGYTLANNDVYTYYNRTTHNGKKLDVCLYKGNITVSDFRVCEEAVDDPDNPDTETHTDMLSDHFPIAFTVTHNSPAVNDKISSIKGNYRFNHEVNTPEWFDGDQWKSCGGYKGNTTKIPQNSNLNDYRTEGFYSIYSASDAETITNAPIAGGGLLRVIKPFNNSVIMQIYISNYYRNPLFIRRTSGANQNFDKWSRFDAKWPEEFGGNTRPTASTSQYLSIGTQFFDTSLTPPRPIFWTGTTWVDATGTEV